MHTAVPVPLLLLPFVNARPPLTNSSSHVTGGIVATTVTVIAVTVTVVMIGDGMTVGGTTATVVVAAATKEEAAGVRALPSDAQRSTHGTRCAIVVTLLSSPGTRTLVSRRLSRQPQANPESEP